MSSVNLKNLLNYHQQL